MKKMLLAALVIAALPSVASAQVGYLEGALGLTLIPDVEIEPFQIDIPGAGTFEGRSELNFESEFSGGLEGGVAAGQWRFGLAWDFASAQLDTGRAEGTLDGVPVIVEATDDEIADSVGLSFDENVHIFTANAYYNIGAMDVSVRPYVGLGLGVATFEDADPEVAINGTIGARFALGPRSYVGARYRFTWIQGTEDELGLKYEDFTLHTFSLLLGLYIGG